MGSKYVNSLEQRRRQSAFCMVLVMLALGVAILNVGGSGVGPMSLPTGATDDSTHSSSIGRRRIQFTVTTLKGVEGNKGTFIVQTRPDWAPIGTERFEALVSTNFYDGARIFRVLPHFVSQWGIAEDPMVQAEWDSQPLPDDPVLASNLAGTLSFASAGANTRTTQVFVNTVDNKKLDKMGFAPFAEVIEGMDVINMFYSGYGKEAPKGKGPSQSKMIEEGAEYVDKAFPKLSFILGAKYLD